MAAEVKGHPLVVAVGKTAGDEFIPVQVDVDGKVVTTGGSPANPFDQDLNTDDNVQFANTTLSGSLTINSNGNLRVGLSNNSSVVLSSDDARVSAINDNSPDASLAFSVQGAGIFTFEDGDIVLTGTAPTIGLNSNQFLEFNPDGDDLEVNIASANGASRLISRTIGDVNQGFAQLEAIVHDLGSNFSGVSLEISGDTLQPSIEFWGSAITSLNINGDLLVTGSMGGTDDGGLEFARAGNEITWQVTNTSTAASSSAEILVQTTEDTNTGFSGLVLRIHKDGLNEQFYTLGASGVDGLLHITKSDTTEGGNDLLTLSATTNAAIFTGAVSVPNIVLTGTVQTISGSEVAEPAAPADTGFKIFAMDAGGGKTKLMVRFASGASQQIAVEP